MYIRTILYMLLTLACKKYSNSNIAAKTKNKVFFCSIIKISTSLWISIQQTNPRHKIKFRCFYTTFSLYITGVFFSPRECLLLYTGNNF